MGPKKRVRAIEKTGSFHPKPGSHSVTKNEDLGLGYWALKRWRKNDQSFWRYSDSPGVISIWQIFLYGEKPRKNVIFEDKMVFSTRNFEIWLNFVWAVLFVLPIWTNRLTVTFGENPRNGSKIRIEKSFEEKKWIYMAGKIDFWGQNGLFQPQFWDLSKLCMSCFVRFTNLNKSFHWQIRSKINGLGRKFGF
jgi:hypothetical protein